MPINYGRKKMVILVEALLNQEKLQTQYVDSYKTQGVNKYTK